MIEYFKQQILVIFQMPFGENKSGRGNGVVFQKNGVMRNFVAPTLVHSVSTGFVRSMFSAFQTAFVNLTQAQQKAWNDFSFMYTNRFSSPKSLSGRSGYVRLNSNLTNTGQSNLTVPPVTFTPAPQVVTPVLTATDSTHALSLAYVVAPSHVQMLVFATAPTRPSIFRPAQGKFKLISYFTGDSAGPVVLTSDYNTVYGSNSVAGAGNKIFIQLVPISDTGNAGSTVQISTVIV